MPCHAGRAQNQNVDVQCQLRHSQTVQQKGPNISRLDLALQQQWDHAANAHLGPIDVKSYSRITVRWSCDQCPDQGTYTAGRKLSPTGAMAMVALSAGAAKCASTTLWPPRLPCWHLSGTMRQSVLHLTVWWPTAISLLVGFVMSAATSGAQHLMLGSARTLAVRHAVASQRRSRSRSHTHPLHSARP